MENFRFLIRRSSDSQQDDAVNRTTSGLQPDEDDAANLTKEELYELFWKLNLSVAIEPPPSSESGSGDAESGMTYTHQQQMCYLHYTELFNNTIFSDH